MNLDPKDRFRLFVEGFSKEEIEFLDKINRLTMKMLNSAEEKTLFPLVLWMDLKGYDIIRRAFHLWIGLPLKYFPDNRDKMLLNLIDIRTYDYSPYFLQRKRREEGYRGCEELVRIG